MKPEDVIDVLRDVFMDAGLKVSSGRSGYTPSVKVQSPLHYESFFASTRDKYVFVGLELGSGSRLAIVNVRDDDTTQAVLRILREIGYTVTQDAARLYYAEFSVKKRRVTKRSGARIA